MPNDLVFPSDLAESLLASSDLEARVQLLRQRDLLDEPGLGALVDASARMVEADPEQAARLAESLGQVAESLGHAAIVPRALYAQAQAMAVRGELRAALDLIEAARRLHETRGDGEQALRTNFGLMHVLNEMGRHEEAVQAGDRVLQSLNGAGDPDRVAGNEEKSYLAAVALQNRGACYNLMGRYAEAGDDLRRAGALFDALDQPLQSAMSTMNLGVTLLALGRADDAIGGLERAERAFDRADMPHLRAQVLTNLGDAHLLRGDFARCLDTFETARQVFSGLGDDGASNAILTMDTADAYLAINLFPEALESYQVAESTFRSSDMAYQRARALWGLGATLVRLGRPDEASDALKDAERLFKAAGNVPLHSSVLLEQAALDEVNGQGDLARRKATDALALVSGGEFPVQAVYAHLRLADLAGTDSAEADDHLEAAAALVAGLGLPNLEYRLAARQGRVRMQQGRADEAVALLEQAVEKLEVARGALALEALRTSFLKDKTTAYEDLVALYLARGDAGSLRKAFAIAERAKSRSLVDMIVGLVDREMAWVDDPDLAARLGQLRGDLNAIYNAWLGGSGGEQRSVALAELHSRAALVEREIERLRIRGSALPGRHNGTADAPSLDELPTDLPVVAYHILGHEVVAFVALSGRLEVVRGLADLPEVVRQVQHLSGQWERFRAGPEFVQRHAEQLELSARRALETLHRLIFAPVEAVLCEMLGRTPSPDDPAPLVIVPHGALHHIPFHALHDGSAYVLDRYAVSYAPSATVLALCQGRDQAGHGRSVVLGVADSWTPGAASEARAIEGLVDHASAFIDAAATRNVMLEEAGHCDLLHVACHGLFRADNPMFSALKLYDGWITAGDVLSHRLDGALVTLSACESGKGEVVAGDEVMGFTRAFLGAGAASVVVSLWLVQDATTERLMGDWYATMRDGGRRVDALREAQLRLRDEHPHPYYWAPFLMVGQR